MSDLFYRAFEERLYAPRETIRRLRQQYLPFVEPLKSLYPGVKTFDLGCGRGEWLELMLEAGFDAFGVDLDEGMLEACRTLSLPAAQGDAVAHLAALPDDSHAVISAFHVVEHISFMQLRQVVEEALRVLKPGGLLIMETPNPENIVVGTSNFYIDPTHQRPIPSLLLSFLTEHQGYARTKVLRLQESPTLLQQQVLSLHDVFSGVSPDYAVIAQKDALSASMKPFDEAFSREYGLSLHALSQCYDRSVLGPVQRLDTLQHETAAKQQALEQASDRLASMQRETAAKHQALETRLQASDRRVSTELERLAVAQQASEKAHQELDAQLQRYVHHNLHHVALDVQNLHRAHHALSAQLAQQVRVQEENVQVRLQQAERRAQVAEHASAVAQAALASVYASTSWRLLALPRWCAIQLKLLMAHGPLNRARALRNKLNRVNAPLTQTPLPLNPIEDPPVLRAEHGAVTTLPAQAETGPLVVEPVVAAVPVESTLDARAGQADAAALSARTQAIYERLQQAFPPHSGTH